MVSLKLPFFSRGEISPRLHGRVDTAAYQSGLRTARNTIVQRGGGIMSRPGTLFIGTTKYNDKYTRPIPFAFRVDDTHMLEFGDMYMRVIREDFYQTELAPNPITNITKAVQPLVSCNNSYSNGDEVRIKSVLGMTEINDATYIVSDVTMVSFKLKSTITGDYVDTSAYSAYVSGGAADRIYEIATPYAADDLPGLRYAQSADVMTLVHLNYPIKELKRFDLNDWRLEDPAFEPSTTYPFNLAGNANTTSDLVVNYKITATNDETGVESLPGTADADALHITAATKTNPVVITIAGHGLTENDEVLIKNISGMTELNDRRFNVISLTTDLLSLQMEDGTNYGTFTSALSDSLYPCFIRIADSAVSYDNTLVWEANADANRYSVYRQDDGVYGWLADTLVPTYNDINKVTPEVDTQPPAPRNPFQFVDDYPGAVGYWQQRRVFGGSNNQPDTWEASRPGDFSNFTTSFPIQDDDAITATLASGQINQIKHITASSVMGVFTSGNEWNISSGGEVAFSPFTVKQDSDTNWGSSDHRPYVVGSVVLFVQEDNRTVRSFAYEWQSNQFKSQNVSIASDHIFKRYEIKDWALARNPYSAMIMTRTDGQAACLVYDDEQSVTGWTRWDTKGSFETVGAIRVCLEENTPEPDDGIYFVTKRKVGSRTVQFMERLHDRRFLDVRDCFFVDNGVTFDKAKRITNVTNQGPSGSYQITCPSHGYVTDMVVDFADIEWEPVIDTMGNETQPDQLNDNKYIVYNVPASDLIDIRLIDIVTTFPIAPVDYKHYVKGGVVRENEYNITGLQHLEGCTVSVLADGFPLRDMVVTDGAITLPGLASRVHVGLPYTVDIETLDIEPQMGSSTIQGKMKKIPTLTVRLDESRECMVGPDSYNLIPMKRAPFTTQSAQLYTGDREIAILPSWNPNGRVFFRQLDPMPITILGIYPDIGVSGG